MRLALRSINAAVSALAVAAVAIFIATMHSIVTTVALASTTVLIMGGTGNPLSSPPDSNSFVQQYVSDAVNNYVSSSSTAPTSTGIPEGPYNGVAVITPAEGAPNYGTLTVVESVNQGLATLHGCLTSSVCKYNKDVGSAAPSPSDTFVVYGYSQSAAIAMLEKARLAAEYAAGEGPDVSFVVVGGARPNGGLVARDTTGLVAYLLLGVQRDELITDPVLTDTQYSTVNAAIQYDGFADFPLNPLNLFAVLNAYMGIILVHGAYGDHSLDDPGVVDQGQHGDTHYYLMPSGILPLLTPLAAIPVVGHALADALDPVLRVVVEAAYDRSTSPGELTPFNIFYAENPNQFVGNVLMAIPTGLDNGFQDLFGVRPLGTERPGAFGVGGSDVSVSELSTAGSPGPSELTASSTSREPVSGNADSAFDSTDTGAALSTAASSATPTEVETSDSSADATSTDPSPVDTAFTSTPSPTSSTTTRDLGNRRPHRESSMSTVGPGSAGSPDRQASDRGPANKDGQRSGTDDAPQDKPRKVANSSS